MLELLLGLIGGGLGAYFGTYLREKAKGLATKEDIGEITRRVEDAKKQYTRDLAEVTEALKARTGMRMLAGERRLQAHQEAYTFWNDMLNAIHEPEKVFVTLTEGARWWEKNALYLEAAPREAFRIALKAFGQHQQVVEMFRGAPEGAKNVVANKAKIDALGEIIVRACELPRLVEGERIEELKGVESFGVATLTLSTPTKISAQASREDR